MKEFKVLDLNIVITSLKEKRTKSIGKIIYSKKYINLLDEANEAVNVHQAIVDKIDCELDNLESQSKKIN